MLTYSTNTRLSVAKPITDDDRCVLINMHFGDYPMTSACAFMNSEEDFADTVRVLEQIHYMVSERASRTMLTRALAVHLKSGIDLCAQRPLLAITRLLAWPAFPWPSGTLSSIYFDHAILLRYLPSVTRSFM
ncbi:hypothetical protein HGRIS_013985 [Hohenbuehelia grisea]|uniref:Uncharacterized protein n=1 Tax=Hohenbuehelia grisea TaxID=104357 RepID=A0ABR3JTE7_9AGAR